MTFLGNSPLDFDAAVNPRGRRRTGVGTGDRAPADSRHQAAWQVKRPVALHTQCVGEE